MLLGLLSRRLRSKMPTPSLGGREPPVHKIAGDPRTSTTSDSEFYTAWCRMYSYELFTPKTSEVFQFFHPPPPPPPPPRHRRSSLWDVSATVPQERPENGSEVHWSNPYGPDPPEMAPPAAEPVIEDASQKATKLSAISSSCREEGFKPDSTLADAVSEPCSSTPPVEEPAFAALANLRVCAEMPASFTLSEYYSRQGPLSPCSPAPTESYGGREARFSHELAEHDYGGQGLLSPAPTEYVFDPQAWSPASTQFGAPLPEHGGEGLTGGFGPKFPPGVPIKPDDLLREHNDCPFGMPPPDDSTAHFCQDRNEVSEICFEECSAHWCGLFSSCC